MTVLPHAARGAAKPRTEIEAAGLKLVAISYDSREVLVLFASQFGITFPLLSDDGSATIRRYGLLNTVAEAAVGPNRDDPEVAAEVRRLVSEVGANERMAGIAYPGTFVLDRNGMVTARFFEDSYIERNTVAQVLVAVNRSGSVAGRRVSTAHLDVTAYPTDTAVAPGNRFGLVLDITPRPGMHVYAPGATGYRVIAFTMAPQPFLHPQPLAYPESEIYHFEPLDERVPVYQKPFRLVQDVTLAGDLATQKQLRGRDAITISGTLETRRATTGSASIRPRCRCRGRCR